MSSRKALSAAARSVRVEGLESRRLFDGSAITGRIYHDRNGNDAQSIGEEISSTHAVYLDLNKDGSYDSTEPVRYGSSAGYRFENLADGEYVVRLLPSEMAPGEFSTSPTGARTVKVQYGLTTYNTDLGYAKTGSIAGHTYEEYYAFSDYLDSRDTLLTGRTLYIDTNDNGALDAGEPSATTPESGRGYAFDGLRPGQYVVRQVVPDGWWATTPFAVVTALSGQEVTQNFGSRQLAPGRGGIVLTAFADLNGNGTRESFEQRHSGASFYLDLNRNGVFDVVSDQLPRASSSGGVTFVDLSPGTYDLRYRDASRLQTTPSWNQPLQITVVAGEMTESGFVGSTAATADIEGVVFSDINANGVQDAGEGGLFNARVYIDSNDNGAFDTGERFDWSGFGGVYSFSSLPIGPYHVRVVPPTGYRLIAQTGPHAPQSSFDTDATISLPGDLLFDGKKTSFDFAVHRPATISGIVFNDGNRDGQRGNFDLGIAGRLVWIDTNDNGVFDDGERSTVTDSTGSFEFDELSAGEYIVRQEVPDGWRQTLSANATALHITLTTGQQYVGVRFGQFLVPTTGTITGHVYSDLNGDGIRNTDEPSLNGQTIFADSNGNGTYDTGEPFTSTDFTGAYRLDNVAPGMRLVGMLDTAKFYREQGPASCSVFVVADSVATAPDLVVIRYAAVHGFVYDDANGDRVRQWNENGLPNVTVFDDRDMNGRLDIGEATATTRADGSYRLNSLRLGNSFIRPILPDGFRASNITGQGLQAKFGGNYELDFLATSKSAIEGIVVVDTNKNNHADTGEVWLSGQIVYADLNQNDRRDEGEPFTLSRPVFSLGGLEPGTYTLRLDLLPDETVADATAMERVVTVDAGRSESVAPFTVDAPTTPYLSAVKPIHVVETIGSSIDVSAIGTYTTAEWDLDYDPDLGFTPDFLGLTPHISLPDGDGKTHLVVMRFLNVTDHGTETGPLGAVAIDYINLSPTAIFAPTNRPANEGAGVTFVNIMEASVADRATLKYSYDFDNDGIFDVVDSLFSSAKLPAAMASVPGTYTVRGRIADKDGGFNDYTTTVTVTPARFGSISGSLFSDANGDGIKNAGDSYLGDRTVFLDANNNYTLDAGETQTLTDPDGNFSFTGLAAGTYRVRRVLPKGYTYSTALTDTVLAPGESVSDLFIGAKTGKFIPPPPPPPPVIDPPPSSDTGTIAGYVFSDSNGDGVWNNSETKLSDRVVFLDTNNNFQLDAGERQTTTDTAGNYRFDNLAAGTYHVRRVLPKGYTYSTALIDLTLAEGQTASPQVIGATTGTFTPPPPGTDSTPDDQTPDNPPPASETGTLSGYLFNDANKNGVQDGSEGRTTDRTVFLDSNNNGKLDAGERQTTTDNQGRFSFTDLPAGVYHVRRVFPKGFTYSTALIDVSLGDGESADGLTIGSRSA